jgi:hypothetical protein
MNLRSFSCQSILFVCLAVFTLAISSGCSNGSDNASPDQGPTADLSEELTGGNGAYIGSPPLTPLPELGYVEAEYVASGTAVSYRPTTPQTEDGLWSFEADGSAQYRTRILVRRPENPADFSGTVIVEWLNVSGGLDANVEWLNLEEEITRQGHVWVGVSAQLIGVEGGPVLVGGGSIPEAGKGLKAIDPDRYASLSHPGDGFSFDIFTQVARALRNGGPALGHMEPEILIATGESQSAFAMVTYYNGVQPLTQAFDGFLVHSRGSGSLPLMAPGEYAFFSDAVGAGATRFRADVDAPVMNIQAENDTTGYLNSSLVRQPDSDTFRLWEVAGTAHADTRLVGFARGNSANCGLPINDGPQHFVAKAAINSLDKWVRTGGVPPAAQRLEVTATTPANLVRDADGIVLGGVRTPPVDVPVEVLSGVAGPNFSAVCFLLGSTAPMSEARLAVLYASPEDYVQRYAASTDAAIAAGFVLEADREALIAESDPSKVPN